MIIQCPASRETSSLSDLAELKPTIIPFDMFGPIERPNSVKEYHRLWGEIHSGKITTQGEFDDWIRQVPDISCSCRAWLMEYVKVNRPTFDDMSRYSFNLHNAVNEKLGKPRYAWENYQSQYLGVWKRVSGYRIGFSVANYESLGGTETFHQALVPRLPNVIGFATLSGLRGDVSLLGVPTGQGTDAISSLSSQCDTVVSWNIDWSGMPRPKRLVTVHHGSLADTPSTELCLQGDSIVCVSREVAEYVKATTDKPVHCIEPAVDPARLIPQNAVDTDGKKICLWAHRFSLDKRPQLAAEIAKHLPDDWRMVLTGHRGESIELNDRVTVLPPQHPGDWLSVASCFLSTSLFEGFGLSVAEAITAGVPVVSTPIGIASRPGLALTVDSDADPETWAVAILASQSMALPSRDLFSVEEFIKQWESVINTA